MQYCSQEIISYYKIRRPETEREYIPLLKNNELAHKAYNVRRQNVIVLPHSPFSQTWFPATSCDIFVL